MNDALFIGAILLSTVFILIFLFVLLHKRGDNKKLAKQKVVLADIIWKNKLEISEQETINNYLLAIDKVNFILLYINFSNAKEEVTLIDLWSVKAIKVTTEDNAIYEQRKGKSVLADKQITKLQLEITLANMEQKTDLVLYEYKDGMRSFVEVKDRANYWCQLINKAVQEFPTATRQSSKYA